MEVSTYTKYVDEISKIQIVMLKCWFKRKGVIAFEAHWTTENLKRSPVIQGLDK